MVSIVDFVFYPEKYDKKRIVLTGVWHSGWEWSYLDVENSAQDFKIWVTLETAELAKESPALLEKLNGQDLAGVPFRICAEGSFFFRKFDTTNSAAFGHLGRYEACFIVDRLFELERIPDKSPSP